MEQIAFLDEQSGEEIPFYILEQTELGGDRYLLVTDGHPDEEDALAYIFKIVRDNGDDLTYEEVTDDKTLEILSGVFEELLGDTSLH